MAALELSTAQIADAGRTRAIAALAVFAADISWNIQSAQDLVDQLRRPAGHAGFTISIVGSVATRGHSNRDLDLAITPTASFAVCDGFDTLYDFITRDLGAQDLGEAEGYQCFRLPDGRIVDIYTGEFWN